MLFISLLRAEETSVNRSHLGLNLGGFNFSKSTIIPFNDIAKIGTPWAYSPNPKDPKPKLDALGNWIPEAGKVPFSILLKPEAHGPSGKYSIKWQGRGKVEIFSKLPANYKITESNSNSFIIDVPESPDIALKITKSDPQDPVTQVQCFVPDSESEPWPFRKVAFETYHPLFSTVRFMDWQETNGSHQKHWENRPVPDQQTFRLEERRGVPLEWMIDYCNTLHISPWFCMPHEADDNYIRQFAMMVKEKLNPELKIYVEYSNEVWNTHPAFDQTSYAVKMAETLPHPVLVKKAKFIFAAWYAHRSKQIWEIWDQVYGGREPASRKIVRVAGGFYAYLEASKAKLTAYDLYKSSDVFAIAPYAGLNRDLKNEEFDASQYSPTQLIEMVKSQIETDMERRLKENADLARQYNLPLIAYESGINFTIPSKSKEINAATNLIVETSRLPEMEPIMEAYMRKWFKHTNGLLNLFVDYATPGMYGTYDNIGEYPGQPEAEAHRLRAVLRVLKDSNLFSKPNP